MTRNELIETLAGLRDDAARAVSDLESVTRDLEAVQDALASVLDDLEDEPSEPVLVATPITVESLIETMVKEKP